MSTYMKTNALNTAFQLLKVIASGKLLQEQITEAEAELHIHFDQKQLLTANSALLDLLEKIKVYMLHESILNTETFEAPAFKMDGGFARFNKKFGGQLAEIIREINTYIYEGAA